MAIALVTGATGFLGAWVAHTLVEEGHQVRILRRSSSRLDALGDLPVEHHIGDVTTPDSLPSAVDGVDWVFHVAAVADYWRSGKDKIYHVNVDGTRWLLQACEAAGVERFIFTSSAAALGFHPDKRHLDESHLFSVDPRLTPYGHSKFLAEAEVYQALERGLDCVILNPAVILGPGDLNLISGSLVIEIAKGRVPFLPMQGGVTVIDVRDVAMSHLRAAEIGQRGERYLLGTVNISHRALMRLIAEEVGVKPPYIPLPAPLVQMAAVVADVCRSVGLDLPSDVEGNQLRLSQHDIYFDCSKAQETLYKPQIDLPQSIHDTYEWYRAHGYL